MKVEKLKCIAKVKTKNGNVANVFLKDEHSFPIVVWKVYDVDKIEVDCEIGVEYECFVGGSPFKPDILLISEI